MLNYPWKIEHADCKGRYGSYDGKFLQITHLSYVNPGYDGIACLTKS